MDSGGWRDSSDPRRTDIFILRNTGGNIVERKERYDSLLSAGIGPGRHWIFR